MNVNKDPDILNEYIKDCELLSRDLRRVLDDLDFEERGGIIRYAVDHSEIFAYVFPFDGPERLRVFSDDDQSRTIFTQQYVLNRIFFRWPDPLILLTPYAMELEAMVAAVQRGVFDSTISQIPKIHQDVQAALTSKEYRSIIELAQSLQHDPKELTDKDFESAVSFIVKNLTSLVLLLEDDTTAPLSRTNSLLQSTTFESLSDMIGEVEPDAATVSRWNDKLLKSRGRSPNACYLDAIAVGILKHANDRITSANKRIYLITRSSHMERLARDNGEAKFWESAGGDIIRHPRTFSVLHRPEDKTRSDILQRMLLSLEAFLWSAKSRKKDAVELEAEALRILREIKEEWNTTERLSASLIKELPRRRNPTLKQEEVRKVLSLLVDNKNLASTIKTRIDSLSQSLERNHQLLGLVLQSQNRAERKKIESSVSVIPQGNRSILASSLHSMPYTLQFYTAELKQSMELFAHGRTASLHDVLELFRKHLSETFDPKYERLLFMAYLFGLMRKWDLAERYCNIALAQPKTSDLPHHEALFFLAVCLRINASRRTPQRYELALQMLQEAGKLKATRRGDPGYKDPRYMKEEATTIFSWHSDRESLDGDLQPPSIEEALRLSEAALQLVKDDKRLKAQIHNNLCYHFTDHLLDFPDSLKLVVHHLDQLRQIQSEISASIEDWPPQFVDTVLWAQWKLSGRSQDNSDLLHRLQSAINSDDISWDKQRVEFHLSEIQRGLDGE